MPTRLVLTMIILLLSSASTQAQNLFTISGNINTQSPSFNRPAADCNTLSGNTTRYDLAVFSVDTSGIYNVISTQSGFDGFIHVYTDDFDRGNPLRNCVTGNDDSGSTSQSQLTVTLQADVIYFLVTSGFDSAQNGSFNNTIQGVGNVRTLQSAAYSQSTIDSRTWARPNANCQTLSSTSNSRYETQILSVNVSGEYTIATEYENFDGYVHLYDEQFNPFDPFLGCIDGDDDSGPGGLSTSQLNNVFLHAGRSYYIVNSGFNDTDSGTYTTRISGPGGVFLQAGTFSLAALSGLWFDPALDGSGFNILASDAGVIVTFYGYIAGEQRWLISELISNDIRLEQVVTASMLIGDGGTLANPIPGGSLPAFGTLRFGLTSCTSGEALLTGSGDFAGAEQFYALTRLLQGTGRSCPE